MPTLDLSFSNQKILDYFEGKNEVLPVGELLYIHTHFIEKNFLSELEIMIAMAGEVFLTDKRKAGVGQKMSSVAERLAVMIHDINEETAKNILPLLRQLYGYCKVILK